jgi:hypothetical protein
MEKPDYIPKDYPGIRVVQTLGGLQQPFGPDVNCNLLPRDLSPLQESFNALAAELGNFSNHFSLNREQLAATTRSITGSSRVAAEFLLEEEMPQLSALFNSVVLKGLKNAGLLTRKFHMDGITARGNCCYTGDPTQAIRNDDIGKVEYHGLAATFESKENAEIFSFRPGDISVHAGLETKSVQGFIHRAPTVLPDDPLRLRMNCDFPRKPGSF